MNAGSQTRIDLGDDCCVTRGAVPEALIPNAKQFAVLWSLHPSEYSEVKILGKQVKVPRWDRAYGKDYPFSHQVAAAHAIPVVLEPYLQWAREAIDGRLNGLFVNWHDGKLSHYHGKHRDSTQGLIAQTPILTISLGEERIFRMRTYPDGNPKRDFVLQSGDYIVIPWHTNERWTHEIPKFARYKDQRISVTIRAFED